MIVPTDAAAAGVLPPFDPDAAYRSLLAGRTILTRASPAGWRRSAGWLVGTIAAWAAAAIDPSGRSSSAPPSRRPGIAKPGGRLSGDGRRPRARSGGRRRAATACHGGTRHRAGRVGQVEGDGSRGRRTAGQVRRACADSGAPCGSDTPTVAGPWPTSMRSPGRPAWTPGRAAQAASIRARSSSRKWTSTTFRAPA